MNRLSTPIDAIRDHYSVVVIGSGYGGAISAARFARAGQSVCVLERGREIHPGSYPRTLSEAASEMQADVPNLPQLGSRTGLYDFRGNEDINVFVGCGLGGTSLVNANVALPAEPRVFEDPRWPAEIREDYDTVLAAGYRHAQQMLMPTPYPEDYPPLAKLAAHEVSAKALPGKYYRPPLTVTFAERVNSAGVEQHACTNCGDCVSGCNYAAKNSVLMNYLPDAHNFGAEIFTQVCVRSLERRGDDWLVLYQRLGSGAERFDAPTQFVRASIVVLAAGTLGSTEILLRSKAAGLPLSDAVGEGFTGNGDVLAFGYNCDQEVCGVGHGPMAPNGRTAVGPTIAGVIDVRQQPILEDGMVIEEGALPGPLAPIFPVVFSASAKAHGSDTDAGWADLVRERSRELESLLGGAYRGAMRNTQTYLVMTHDDARGRITLENDRVRVHWPAVGKQAIFAKVSERLQQATKALGGTFMPSPLWTEMFKHDLVTVHPLGGCCMAQSAEGGVVNHKGQVFAGAKGEQVHANLYVSDGSIIPRSLGVNPLLTISALAEGNVALAAAHRTWAIDDLPTSKPRPPSAPLRLGLQFTEAMRGFVSTATTAGDTKLDYQRAWEQGRASDSTMEFTLTIVSDDLNRLLEDPAHPARMTGTLVAPVLSAEPLTATDGEFSLFILDPKQVGTRRMEYRMTLTTVAGQRFFFHGYKLIHSDQVGLDAWSDTTTLYVTVHTGRDSTAPVLCKGRLHIELGDFARQMTTVQVTNARSLSERLEAVARFGRYFGGSLWATYGGLARRDTLFDPSAPPRQRRALRASDPEIHFVTTRDGVELRLTRYRGGRKGPVLLAHGLGVSSLIFTIDTIDTNLVEYLFASGYDVWCLDFRVSIALPGAASAPSSGDDVASNDYPAAIEKIRAVTGAASVQAVVHCWGSTTFFMAMLAGLEGVRSIVASQVATHIQAPVMTRLKTGLHVPRFLRELRVDSLSAYVDQNRDWQQTLFDAALKLYPTEIEELCDSAVCRRIAFMYAPLYEHDQLNAATHMAMHEMFGIANIRAFEHLARLVNTGHLIGFDGDEAYLPNLQRLNLPICFIHGAENACFRPESTRTTFELLRKRFGPANYIRHVIPNYGHIDCIFGQKAYRDVYPHVVNHLDKTASL